MHAAIPNRSAVLDKDALIGGCTRLQVGPVPLETIRAEIEALPAGLWGTRGGRVGVHNAAEAIFLRGHAPAEGDLPIEDRPPLDALPSLRTFIEHTIPAPPLRCLLARLPAGATIAPHIDRADYFAHSIRIHLPIQTEPGVLMISRGKAYRMGGGEVWALNNSNLHAVLHDGQAPRTHLICDFMPSEALVALLRDGERDLHADVPGLTQRLDAIAAEYRARMLQQ